MADYDQTELLYHALCQLDTDKGVNIDLGGGPGEMIRFEGNWYFNQAVIVHEAGDSVSIIPISAVKRIVGAKFVSMPGGDRERDDF